MNFGLSDVFTIMYALGYIIITQLKIRIKYILLLHFIICYLFFFLYYIYKQLQHCL